jgi:hypothetical protein
MRLIIVFLSLALGALHANSQLFSDDFTRPTDPGDLGPWTVESGNFTITGGVFRAGTNDGNSFTFAYVTNSWTNYSVQAQVRFSSTSGDGAGLGARFNPYSGAHYAAWISPENSSSGGPMLQILKFQTWLVYQYTNNSFQEMASVNLASVGTNWHTLKLTVQGNQIAAYYDNNLVATATDNESNPITFGGISVDASTTSTMYNFFVDNVVVNPLPSILMAVNDRYFVGQNGSLTVPAPGLLGNDTPGAINSLSAVRLNNPANGTLSLNANGGFTYTPNNNFTGIDSFSYRATDGVSTSGVATVTFAVTPSTNIFFDNFTRSGTNDTFAPWVLGLGHWYVGSGTLIGSGAITDYYSDSYVPGVWGDFSVQTRFQIPSGGWACGISGRVNPITGARYVANVYPETSPFKPTPALRLIKFHTWGTWSSTYTAMALVTLPSVGTSYHTLKMVCYGNNIDVYYDGSRVVHAVDDMVDGIPFYRSGAFGAHMYMYSPPFNATFDDYNASAIGGVNYPPVLGSLPDQRIGPGTTLVVTNTASDFDIPVNALNYALVNPPAGAVIDTNGIISWTPSPAQDLSTNLFTTIVTDSFPTATNSQHLTATNSFTVIVNSRPAIISDSTSILQEGCTPANNAIDPGEVLTMSFAFKNVGYADSTNLVATLLSTNGVSSPSGAQTYGALAVGGPSSSQPFTFLATAQCGGTVSPTFQLQDGALNLGLLTITLPVGRPTTIFTQRFDTVTPPALPSGWTSSAAGVESNWVTQAGSGASPPNVAFSPDVANVGLNELDSPQLVMPLGPAQISFANSYDLETNSANPAEAFDGGVLEIKIGNNAYVDIIAAGGSFVTNGYNLTISTNYLNPLGGRQAWSGTSGGYLTTIVNLPASVSGQTIQFRWRCGTDNSNGRTGWRIDSIGVTAPGCCANNGPILAQISNISVNELTTLTVTNSATDSGAPPSGLTYSLSSPPAGASIDSNGVITWTPTEAQGPSTNIITTIVTDNQSPPLSATNSFQVIVNEVNVAPVLPAQANRTIIATSSLTVTNAATDSDIPANTLTYSLTTGPTNATINANGVINWTPLPAQVPSTNVITTVVTDFNPTAVNSQHLTATNSFAVFVAAIHNGPSLPAQSNRGLAELTTLRVTNSASDSDIPALTLNYTLVNPPSGAVVDGNGIITWTPSEAQGPSTNTFTTVVVDNGSPPLGSTNIFQVIVYEVNTPPVLPAQTNVTIDGLATLTVTNRATDSDIPTNTLTYSLTSAPTNATISSSGVITWTPVISQVPSTNLITTVVTDFNSVATNSQHLSATNSFTVFVRAIHNGPSLATQSNRSLDELTTLRVTNTATDSDIPSLALTYSLVNPPTGAVIDANGVITWTPTEAQGPSTNTLTTIVNDNGFPPLSATNSFVVIVNEINLPPVLPVQTNITITGLTTIVVTNTATDPDLPANTLTYVLSEAPTNATISSGGVIDWTPLETDVPGTYTFTTVVTDFSPFAINSQHLSATNSFTVAVRAVHNGPGLPAQSQQMLDELTTLRVTNTASDSDVPALTLTYSLLDSPNGAAIDAAGVITWTPSEAQGPSTNIIVTVVTDNGSPALSATNSFEVIVNEINLPPVLPLQTNRTIVGLSTLIVTNTATDPDLPANLLTYELVSGPTNAIIDTNGIITWTPEVSDVPSTNEFVTVVTDYNPEAINSRHLSATNTFTVIVDPVRNPPILPSQTNYVVVEPATLVVTNTAIENDIPTLPLTYVLIDPPTGAVIDQDGIIHWTPTSSEAPSTNVFQTVVTDNPPAGPGLSTTNSFLVFVEASSTPPPPVFQSISISNDVVLLTWSSVAGKNYQLQSTEDLNQQNWTNSLPPVNAVGPTAGVSDSVGTSTQRFYRVLLLP